jgi:carnitine 3-dehydrogenase
MASPSIAVIGCGLIGESWSGLFVAHGLDVLAWDPNPAAREALSGRVDRIRRQLVSVGPLAERPGVLAVADTLADAVREATWIQENGPENTQVKHRLYADIEAAAASDFIIASSTSSLTWSQLSVALNKPERLITAHPFNPPHLMPLVEIFAKDDDVRRRADTFYRAVGREPVHLRKDAVGHIANRLASAIWREAVNIVVEGIADVSDVDAALVHGPGLRWSVTGAHMNYHLGGGPGGMEHYLQHLGPSQERRWATLGTPSLTPEVCRLLVEGVAREAAGRSVEDLEEFRDRGLIQALAAKRGHDER